VITVNVRIYNDTDQKLENQPVRLFINETQRAVATYSVPPFAHTTVLLTYTTTHDRIQQGFAEINDYPVTFDDRYYFSFGLSSNIPVMIINQGQPNRFLNTLLGADTTFVVRNVPVGSIDYSQFGGQSLIIINGLTSPGGGLIQELTRYVNQGGHLLLFPGAEIDMDAWRQLFQSLEVAGFVSKAGPARVTSINELHPVYESVFDRIPQNINLPAAEQYYVMERRTRDRSRYLMQFQNGDNFMAETPSGQGSVYVSAVPADDTFSNFPRHAMFVPTLYNIALHSTAFYPLAYTLGLDDLVVIRNYRPASGALLRITAPETEIIPESRTVNNNIHIILHGQIETDGNYNLVSDGGTIRSLSFNFDRRESLLDNFTIQQIQDAVLSAGLNNIYVFEPTHAPLQKQMELMKAGVQLWKIFLLMGLFFLFSEVLLLRFLK
jgi:hypothetical protein